MSQDVKLTGRSLNQSAFKAVEKQLCFPVIDFSPSKLQSAVALLNILAEGCISINFDPETYYASIM